MPLFWALSNIIPGEIKKMNENIKNQIDNKTENTEEKFDTSKKTSWFGKNKRFVTAIFLTIVISYIISKVSIAIFEPIIVSGPSMEPTFHNGNILLSESDITRDDLHRGDVVVFNVDINVIKRIVGLPGETLVVKDGVLYIDGVVYDDLQFDAIEDPGVLWRDYTLREDQYFCVGDNRNESYDSRWIGPIMFDEIKCKITKKLFSKETF